MYSYNLKIKAMSKQSLVSILIQVVNVFLFYDLVLKGGRLYSLNPYSGGKCIPIKRTTTKKYVFGRSLNPYSGGKCIPICCDGRKASQTTKSQSLFRW